MKHSFLFFIALFSVLQSSAQNSDKTLARVRYTFKHVSDTTQRDQPRIENMLLVIGKNASLYTSYDKLMQGMALQRQLEEQIKNQSGSTNGNIQVNATSKTGNRNPLTSVDYYYFAKEHKFITRERLFNSYLVEEDAPQIAWKIEKDTMSFSGIACQKATAKFKGRNWIAWYATELPFPSGPWKLNGLPGLIISAKDDKNEVMFEFAGIENVTSAVADGKSTSMISSEGNPIKVIGMDVSSVYMGPEISLPTDGIKTSRKELDKLKEARDKDPQGFMQAQMAGSGIAGSIKIQSVLKPAGTASKKVVNNPIELSEKK
ncbi:MAG: GLPGLI family protein [Pedobacter sp.]|nr:MAG: GLPGLI family protein [Pedobacter sp.]